MLSAKPSIPTTVTPYEIVGSMAAKFKQHYEIATSGTGEFQGKRLDSEIGPEVRSTISEIYKDLRNHGFYPDGFDVNGNIMWRTALKDKVQDMVEMGVSDIPQDMLIEECMTQKQKNVQIAKMKKYCMVGIDRLKVVG